MEANQLSQTQRYLFLFLAIIMALFTLSDFSGNLWHSDPSKFLNKLLSGIFWILLCVTWLVKQRHPKLSSTLALIGLLVLSVNALQLYFLTGATLLLLALGGFALLFGVSYLYRRWKRAQANHL